MVFKAVDVHGFPLRKSEVEHEKAETEVLVLTGGKSESSEVLDSALQLKSVGLLHF